MKCIYCNAESKPHLYYEDNQDCLRVYVFKCEYCGKKCKYAVNEYTNEELYLEAEDGNNDN